MFKWLKSAASYVVPTVLALGRLASSAGGTLYSVSKFVQWVTQTATPYAHPASLPTAITAMSFNMLMIMGARVLNMYRRFFPPRQQNIEEGIVDESDYDDEVQPPKPTDKNFSDLNCLGIALYIQFVTVGGIISGSLAGYSSLLNADSYVNTCRAFGGKNESDMDPQDYYYVLMLGGYFFLCSAYAFAANNLPSINQNAKNYAHAISTGNIPCNRYVFLTGAIASFGVICTPFFAKFSMEANVDKTGMILDKFYNVNIPDVIKPIFSYTSAIAATEQQLMANIPAVYNVLTRKKKMTYQNERCWEPKVKNFYRIIAGPIDGFFSGCSNFTGFAHQLETHGYNSRHPFSIIFGTLTASSTGALVYFFTAFEGIDRSLEYYHALHGEYPYEQLPQSEEKEFIKDPKVYTTNKSICCLFSRSKQNKDNEAYVLEEINNMPTFEELEIEGTKQQKYCC